ncbi:MAG: MFS transporter [Acidobacteriota bacterium]|nr:MFS transporter [Acidobacteriota bacterium]
MKSLSKYLVLACLYFSQGLPYGFFLQALPIIMRDMGASLPQIGAASLLSLPWALKFLWAPPVDRYGTKKIWILALQATAVMLFLVLGLLPRYEGFLYLMIGFLIANLVAATQDISSDGLAVLLLNRSERGVGNGLQVAGYRLGMAFGGGFILMYFTALQWKGSFLTIAAALALASIPIFFVKEPQPKDNKQRQPMLQILTGFFKRPGIWGWLLVISFYKFGDAMATVMLKPYLRDRGLSVEEFGFYLGTIGVVSGLLGALIGGWLVRFLGRYRAVIFFGIFQGLTVLTYFLFVRGMFSEDLLPYLIGLEYFSGGTSTVAIFTVMMDACRPKTGATDYTIQASLVVVSTGTANVLAGFVAQSLGYDGNFLVSAVLCFTGVALFAWRFRNYTVEQGFTLKQ